MRVKYISATDSTTPIPVTATVVLCSSDDALQVVSSTGKSTLDVFLPSGGDDVRVFDRGNRRIDVTFIISRLHATPAIANNFAFFHPMEVRATGVLLIEGAQSATQGNARAYLKGGIANVSVKRIGVTTITTYSFVGGIPSNTILYPDPL